MIDVSQLHTRGSLVKLSVGKWSARKHDRAVSNAVLADKKAAANGGRFNKNLLPSSSASYDALVGICGEARTVHYAQTLAWGDDGYRLLPAANYFEYTKALGDIERRFHGALAEFIAEYPIVIQRAQNDLGDLYQAADYPSAADVQSRFTMDISHAPIPASGDFRVALPADEIAALEKSIERRLQQSADVAANDARTRLSEAVRKMAEKLDEPDAIFRDTLVGNVADLCDVLQRLNLGDAELETMRARVERDLAPADPADLRKHPAQRAETAKAAKRILGDMGATFGGGAS